MRPRLAERQVALAAVAVLAAVAAVAVSASTRSSSSTGPHPVGSFTALVGSAGPAAFGKHTACGTVLSADTEGIAHPTLPCGARIFITYNGKTVLTQVVDRGPYSGGRAFDLTDALARLLGLRGVQAVHWAYAAPGD
jgi:rare lipoprotein A